ncbi:MAG TPA: acylphosphatase, partial [Oxalicibacterium sp.]|nr:acylphosphatase [Oxalicibacterium sp.]
RNRRDGSVEAMVRGEQGALEQIVTWAHRGPPPAQVTHVDTVDADDAIVDGGHFEIRPTE